MTKSSKRKAASDDLRLSMELEMTFPASDSLTLILPGRRITAPKGPNSTPARRGAGARARPGRKDAEIGLRLVSRFAGAMLRREGKSCRL